ncbi:ABC transporter permease [Herbivorax sp. ANBcel31]|uniref:ABC transporter permease n=1 Tax=Herbivorax sp. ANBcel31 TaxID=3069754 RepID=UPI0027B82BCB|nr:ABC transporter permease [Herbivorax sp. ANBcel31]MDQ2085443.1 ABC transporter permease [Herbivorax sp. ANBcel31]
MVYRLGTQLFNFWNVNYFPSPLNVINRLTVLFTSFGLWTYIIESLGTVFIGYAISIVLGVLIGFTVTHFKFLNENLSGLLLGLQTLPNVCWLPFGVLWFGENQRAIIFIIAIGSIFAISLGTISGINNINPIYIRSAKSLGAKGVKSYLNVIIPASLPSIISGMKQGWLFAWRALMSGEMLLATRGLGKVLLEGRDQQDIVQIVAVMFVIIAMGLSIEALVFKRIETGISEKWGLNKC